MYFQAKNMLYQLSPIELWRINHRLNKAGFTLILTVIWRHFTSTKIRKKSNSFLLYQIAQFHLQIVNNYAYLRKESVPGTSGYLVSLLWSCTKLSQYVQWYKFELRIDRKNLIVSKHRIIISNCFLIIIIIISSDISK